MSTQKEKQLQRIAKVNMKDLSNSWQKYQAGCRRQNKSVKQLLSDVSLYSDVKKITLDVVQEKLQAELNILNSEREQLTPEERDAKRQKLEEENSKKRDVICDRCQGNRILYVYAHSNDCNEYILPTGRSITGYSPSLPGLCGGDDVNFNLCVDCGHLIGFDRELFLAALEQAETEADENGNDM